jgi:hypothetical protein
MALRLYPTLLTGMPFSTDAWPLIRNTELLMENTPIPLTSALFDGYNNYMPAVSIFGVAISELTDSSALSIMAIAVPIVAALTIPIYFVLVKKITQNTAIALIAAALLATAFPYTLFTAGVTKETFANPIYITLILVFLLRHDWKGTLAFSLLSVGLVLTHQLTAFLTLGIIASLTLAFYFSKPQPLTNSNKSNLSFFAILLVAVALYFGLYAYWALPQTINASDLLSVAAYQALTLTAALYIIYNPKRGTPSRTALKAALGLVIIVCLFFILTQLPVLSGAPILPAFYFLFALPLIVSLPICIYALNKLNNRNTSLFLPFFWLLPIIGFALYWFFGNPPNGVGLASRCLNFLLPPLMLLVAVGIYKLTQRSWNKSQTLPKFAAASLIVFLVAVNSFSLYAAVSLQEPYLGYFWRYEPSEYAAAGWTATNNDNQTVTGDVKVSYLLGGYYNQTVNVLGGLRYFTEDASAPDVIYVYGQMYRNGYVLYQSSPVELPPNWTSSLSNYSIIYTNPEVTIYAKP